IDLSVQHHLDEAVWHGLVTGDLHVLPHVNSGLETLPEAFHRHRMRLRDDAGAVTFFDDRTLRFWRGNQKVVVQTPMSARRIFEEVDSSSDVLSDLRANLVIAAPQQIRADVLLVDLVDPLHKDLRGRSLPERVEVATQRPAQPDDVAGDEHPAAENLTAL